MSNLDDLTRQHADIREILDKNPDHPNREDLERQLDELGVDILTGGAEEGVEWVGPDQG